MAASGTPGIVVATVDDVVVRGADEVCLVRDARCVLTTYELYMFGKDDSGRRNRALRFPLENLASFRGSSSFLARYSKILVTAKASAGSEYDLRLSFHDKGYKDMLAKLADTVKMKLWVDRPSKANNNRRPAAAGPSEGFSTRSAGISGIMRRVDRQAREDEATLSAAFADLDTLMAKTRDIVKLAARVKAAQERAARSRRREADAAEAKDEVDLQDHLMSLGMGSVSAPSVSRAAAGSTSAFHTQLARELAAFLTPILADRSTHGVLPLTDVYCLYNRARGTDLVSPDDILAAVAAFGSLSPPVGMSLHEFASGAKVVQSDAYSEEAMTATILDLATASDHGVSASELAAAASLSLMLARQQLLRAEERGIVCRDASVHGLYFSTTRFPTLCRACSIVVKAVAIVRGCVADY
ncbi:vacuolar protein-sorting-associated protein 36 [Thecamonas trahens ATCC 50062]|uniref:Vacuolar protein-sorting-associated protein 36 n=1 Tax=Thecamonas trahens ATCC 50062 TaxID=461836 RepID=A0A0L0DTM1_THETB|nr:vacuolar protein-sorting-associated protein 36 [Thecamonas trahens ATCC 50062]KNC55674.1 vacuolar protein-sorting-associated protein 36 [Thecamonas trahens ATCC 50062]|eukprot:XP_013761442.1 vacuolar protein-sorting-associated protein 36 [Thecamonas trahens ATCC 50062]